MTNETKKRGIGKTLFIALVALTLISCCFLGSTFARYTSGDSGSGSVTVAKWSVEAGEGGLSATFSELSPAEEAYTDTPRTHETGKVKVGEIANEGALTADIFFTDLVETVTKTAEATYAEEGAGITGTGGLTANAAESEVENLFSIVLYYSIGTDTATEATNTVEIDSETAIELTSGQTMYIYASAVWSTNDTNSARDDGEVADALDTWVGENITSVGYTFNFRADQGSETATV